jgi:hypothetical protein
MKSIALSHLDLFSALLGILFYAGMVGYGLTQGYVATGTLSRIYRKDGAFPYYLALAIHAGLVLYVIYHLVFF